MYAEIIWRLAVAALLSSIIGLERQLHQKAAGLRTHALVGLGSALIMIVSQHGFDNVIAPGRVVLDPSRVAAQVVSGIGFLGAGLIFVRKDAVRGLTTAAGIWVCAAVGLACGCGLLFSAVAATALSLALIHTYSWIEHKWMPKTIGETSIRIRCSEQADMISELKATFGSTIVRLAAVERPKEAPGSIIYEFCSTDAMALDVCVEGLLRIPGVIEIKSGRSLRNEANP